MHAPSSQSTCLSFRMGISTQYSVLNQYSIPIPITPVIIIKYSKLVKKSIL